MNAAALALRQIAYENRSFWRNPAAAGFTFAFPIMFLIIFNLLFGGEDIAYFGRTTSGSTFYVPAIAAFSIVTACYTNIAIGISFTRDEGVLKRVRGTPLPPAAYLAGRVGHACLIGVLLVAIVVAFGAVAYSVDVPTTTMPAFVVSVAVGAAAFAALGLAVTALVPNADSAPPIVNFTILPLLFISDVFIPLDDAPRWVATLADIFPIRHFAQALLTAFNPFGTGAGFRWGDLAVVAAWGVAGAAIAIRFFTWEPRR